MYPPVPRPRPPFPPTPRGLLVWLYHHLHKYYDQVIRGVTSHIYHKLNPFNVCYIMFATIYRIDAGILVFWRLY